MTDVINIATPLATATLDTLKRCIAFAFLVFNVVLYNVRTASESLADHFRHWYAAQAHLNFKNYTIVATSSARDVSHHLNHAHMAFKAFSEVCLTKTRIMSVRISVKAWNTAQAMDASLVNSIRWAAHNLWCLWTSTSSHLSSYQRGIVGAFGRLRSVAAVKTLAIKALITQRLFRTNVWIWPVAKFEALRDNSLFLHGRFTEYSAAFWQLWAAVDPRYLFWMQVFCIGAMLIYSPRHIRKLYCCCQELSWLMIIASQDFASPLSQLQLMQLEMVLQRTLPGSYVYDHTTFEQWPGKHHFRSTLQLTRPRGRPSLFIFPPHVRLRIFRHALTSTAQFSWNPDRNTLRLDPPNGDFHDIWSVARSLGYVLPGTVLTIDACAPPPPRTSALLPRLVAFLLSPTSYFVQPRPSGREQLMGMLARLSLPTVGRNLWTENVAASMRAGERWILEVRESWYRVWSFDIGLMLGALKPDGVGRIFPGIEVEYKIVIGDGDMEGEKRDKKILEMTRQLREAVMMKHRDARFQVVVEGLEAWEGIIGREELDDKRVVEEVRAMVAAMNEV